MINLVLCVPGFEKLLQKPWVVSLRSVSSLLVLDNYNYVAIAKKCNS